MAQGLGQRDWSFASPDFPNGGADWAATSGAPENSPYVTGPAVDGFASTTGAAEGVGPVHVNTGANPGSNPAGRAQHWSNLFDWQHGPMFWLLVATILYFGLISLHVGARVGSVRGGLGVGR